MSTVMERRNYLFNFPIHRLCGWIKVSPNFASASVGIPRAAIVMSSSVLPDDGQRITMANTLDWIQVAVAHPHVDADAQGNLIGNGSNVRIQLWVNGNYTSAENQTVSAYFDDLSFVEGNLIDGATESDWHFY